MSIGKTTLAVLLCLSLAGSLALAQSAPVSSDDAKIGKPIPTVGPDKAVGGDQKTTTTDPKDPPPSQSFPQWMLPAMLGLMVLMWVWSGRSRKTGCRYRQRNRGRAGEQGVAQSR